MTRSDAFRRVQMCSEALWINVEVLGRFVEDGLYYVMQEVSARFQCLWGTALYICCAFAESPRGLAAAVRMKLEEMRVEDEVGGDARGG